VLHTGLQSRSQGFNHDILDSSGRKMKLLNGFFELTSSSFYDKKGKSNRTTKFDFMSFSDLQRYSGDYRNNWICFQSSLGDEIEKDELLKKKILKTYHDLLQNVFDDKISHNYSFYINYFDGKENIKLKVTAHFTQNKIVFLVYDSRNLIECIY
jgi:hypothetical protein